MTLLSLGGLRVVLGRDPECQFRISRLPSLIRTFLWCVGSWLFVLKNTYYCFTILSSQDILFSSLCDSSADKSVLLSSVKSTSCHLLIRPADSTGLHFVLVSLYIQSQYCFSAKQMCIKMCIRKEASWIYL